MEYKKKKVAVIGAGLAGALQASVLAKRGYEVHLFEYRDDIRLLEHVPGRSINLALSVRGLSGLQLVGLHDHMKNEYGLPMYYRTIHKTNGEMYEVPYGKKDQAILSIGRRYLNEILITKAEEYPNLTIHFEHKLIDCDPKNAKLKFEHHGKAIDFEADFIIGCDGAYSTVRKFFMKSTVFNFEQRYIPHAYKELCVPPTEDGDFAMDSRGLHIWPRNQFMMIALPNQDRSFTLTLFMPFDTFNSIVDERSLIEFFEKYFPDSIPLIGREKLIADYFAIKDSPLVSIKCSPYNYKDKVLIMGDAAHAMVPFYGQGMNCALEDVTTLDSFLEKYPNDLEKAFDEFSKFRSPDAQAMCDLAMYNYIEMRDLVTKKGFLIRKFFDDLLHWCMPSFWVPLYTSVTFSRMRYHECIKNKKWQDDLLSKVGSYFLKGLLIGVVALGYTKKDTLLTLLQTNIHKFM